MRVEVRQNRDHLAITLRFGYKVLFAICLSAVAVWAWTSDSNKVDIALITSWAVWWLTLLEQRWQVPHD